MIALIGFFWKRIFPLLLTVGAFYFFTVGENYIVGGVLILIAILFWQLGAVLMTGWWRVQHKLGVMIFWITVIAAGVLGYLLYTGWFATRQLPNF